MRLSNDGTNVDYFRMVHKMELKFEIGQENKMLLSTLQMGFRLLEIQAESQMGSIRFHVKWRRPFRFTSIRMIPIVFPLLTLLSH